MTTIAPPDSNKASRVNGASPDSNRASGVNGAPPDLRDMDVETLNKLYPTKLEPMPEAIRQFRPLVMLAEMLMRFFEMAGRKVAIFGGVFIYYRDKDGEVSNIAPDLCVVFDVSMDDIGDDRSYFIERAGKTPAFVMEIGSPSTAERDISVKPDIYAHIGIDEYWLMDPEGGSIYGFKLMGLRLVDGEYEPIELTYLPNGSVRGYSEALGLTLLYKDGELLFIDPATGRRLRRPSEIAADERAAQRRAAVAERRAEAAEAELAELRRRLGDQ